MVYLPPYYSLTSITVHLVNPQVAINTHHLSKVELYTEIFTGHMREETIETELRE